jgi:hypothetical protein
MRQGHHRGSTASYRSRVSKGKKQKEPGKHPKASAVKSSPSPFRSSETCPRVWPGVEMFGVHCKLDCPNCGYRRDCCSVAFKS